MDKLKPCPFCGKSNVATYQYSNGGWKTVCEYCGGQTRYFRIREEAIEAWNRRAEDTPVAYNLSARAKGWQPAGYEAFGQACPICKNAGTELCHECLCEVKSGFDPKEGFAPTNADRLRAMGDRALAEALTELPLCLERGECEHKGISCSDCLYEWLTDPAKES